MKGNIMISELNHRTIIACVLFSFSALLFSSSASASFSYDGKYVKSEYDKSFWIKYKDGNNVVKGGTLAFANVGDKQYIYISHPLGFKDLSYAAESSECHGHGNTECKANAVTDSDAYTVGWGKKDHRNAEVAVHSEHFTLSLGGENLKFDLGVPGEENKDLHITDNIIESKSGGNGKTNVENGNSFTAKDGTEISFLSTLNYNSAQINNGNNYADLGEFYFHSPKTLNCETNSDNKVVTTTNPTGDESLSHNKCYMLDQTVGANYLDGDANNGNDDLIDWQFRFGIEIELSKQLYTDLLEDMTKDVFGLNDINNNNSVVSLNALHASPAKAGFCNDDATGCQVIITEKKPNPNPKPVPEPSTIVMFVLALGLLRIQSKRRNA